MNEASPRNSLRWRLPVLICTILAIAIGSFAFVSYRRMQGVLIQAGGERARGAASQLGSLLVQSAEQRTTQLTRVAADADVQAYARDPTPATEAAARRRLTALLPATGPQTVEIWSPVGELLLAVPGSGGDGGESGGPPASTGALPFRVTSAGLVTEAAVAIPSEDAEHEAGHLLLRRAITGGQGAEAITQLVGREAVIRIGSPGGAWTDLSRAVDPPPLTAPGVTDAGATRAAGFVTATEAVRGTPWLASVSFPLKATLAPAGGMLQAFGLVTIAIIAGAAVAIFIFTGRLTRPLAELSDAASAIAAGEYTRRAHVARTDEIGRLAAAFNTMSATVDDMHARLESRVEERTRELEAFSYSVSHDLRAPLRHIVGFAGLFERHANSRLDPESRRYLRTIVEAGGRMGALIDDLLAFSRLGRSPLEKRRVALRPLVDAARRDVAAEAGGRTIEWVVGDLPEVHGDPNLLRQVFVNLLSNAVKYTAPREPARIEVSAARESTGDVVVAVRDNGVGFDPHYASKLFGVFQRLHRSDEFSGTGIGLANVRQIVNRHGGRTWADGQVDQGATFYVSLPPEEAQPKEAS